MRVDEREQAARVPLSRAQSQIWFMERLQPGAPLYTVPMAFRLTGALDQPALRAALRSVVARHDVLRARFPTEVGVPIQLIEPQLDVPLPVQDLTGVPAADREAAVRRAYHEQVDLGFDLAAGPMFRCALLRLDQREHVLVLVFHHIVFDAGSRGVLLADLRDLYRHFRGQGPAPAPLALQYADHAAEERSLDRSAALAWWTEAFRRPPAPLDLPGRRRPPVQTHEGACLRIAIPAGIATGMSWLAESCGATLFGALLAAFGVLLSRYADTTDVTVGVPVFGRSRPELDPLIGCFVNTMPVRLDLSGDPSFRAAVGRAGDASLDALEHMSVQFDEIVQAVAPDRDPSHTPLVQATFGLLTAAVLGRAELDGLEVEELAEERTGAQFDLSLDVVETPGGWTGELEYNVDLFDAAAAERLAGHWQQLLAEAVNDPDRPVSTLPLLGPAEWERTVVGWNRTDREVPPPDCLHQLFEEQAARTPDAVAVVCGRNRITYAELDRRANQLAQLLRDHGARPEVGVGVCMERSIETIVAFLGILKAGAAYAPLDPEYPPERLAFLLADSRAELLVTDSVTAATLPPSPVPRLLVDRCRAELAARPATPPANLARPDNVACMLYTSGSSGDPKCGMLTHRNYVNYFRFWQERYLQDTPMRVHTQMTSFAFDIFVADTTRPLFTGATVVICPRDVVLSPPDLYALMVREGVNSAEFITPILAALADHLEETGQRLDFMDLIVAGSDVWAVRDFRRVRRLCRPDTRMVAAYGTSETANDNSTFEEADGTEPLEGVVPIGRPVANSRLYVLDRRGQPVPVGVAGELHIGGTGLSRGYHGRPGLTAERFVPDPFGPTGARLYRTGDAARARPDGVLEILGRIDDQVKVNGFRVEPGEVEAVLHAHPDVDEAAVVARSAAGSTTLVGYVTLHPGPVPAADRIASVRAHLAVALPRYLVPAALVVLDRMPLTANHKVDRRALPAPSPDLLGADPSGGRPPTASERTLSGIWSDLLGGVPVGVHDDFFELGGSSLMITRVLSAIRSRWSVELPVQAVFMHPTVAALADLLDRSATAGPAAAPIPPLDRTSAPFELSFGQQQLWLQEQLAPGTPTYTVTLAFALDGPLRVPALTAAVQAVVDRHEALRTVFAVVDGRPRQRVLPRLVVPLPVEDHIGVPADARPAAIAAALQAAEQTCFDLATGPMVEARLLRFTGAEHVLLLVLHHSVTDGWSTGVLLDELSDRYAAQLGTGAADLPPLPVQYADFAAWQRKRLASAAGEAHVAFWRQALAGAPVAARLPVDRTGGRPRGGWLPYTLPPPLRTAVRAAARQQGVTPLVVLLAAWAVLVGQLAGDRDVVVGVPASGRVHPDLERLIGFFVTMLPVRARLPEELPFRALLHQLREVVLAAHGHQELPFEKLVEAVGPDRVPGRNPLFQTAFALDDGRGESLRLAGVTVTELPVPYTTAKFELSLLLTESADRISGGVSYRADLFDASTVLELLESWQAGLEAALARPDGPIGALPRSAAADRGRPVAAAVRTPYRAPGTALEELLAAVWEEVLGVDPIGVHDNFFRLGGHSLLALELAARVEEAVGCPVPAVTLLHRPTIAEFAGSVTELLSPADLDRLVAAADELAALTDEDVRTTLGADHGAEGRR